MEQLKQKMAQDLKDFDASKIKAIAIDIDGTLVNEQIECSLRTEKAVKDLIKTGREVYIVTGRATVTALPFAKQLQLPKYMINYNGAAVYNMVTKMKEFEYNIDSKVNKSIIEMLHKFQIVSIVYSEDQFYYEIENDYLDRYFARVTTKGQKKDFNTLNLDNIKKYFIMGSQQEIDLLYQELQVLLDDKVTFFRTTPDMHNLATLDKPSFCLEIMASGVNKGKALENLLATQNIFMDEVVAFGDDNNDIEMLRMAGWGVAMNNARPTVKNVARVETLSNHNDGVAYFIENYLL